MNVLPVLFVSSCFSTPKEERVKGPLPEQEEEKAQGGKSKPTESSLVGLSHVQSDSGSDVTQHHEENVVCEISDDKNIAKHESESPAVLLPSLPGEGVSYVISACSCPPNPSS